MTTFSPREPDSDRAPAARQPCDRRQPASGRGWRRLRNSCKRALESAIALWLRFCEWCERAAKALSPFKIALVCVVIALDVTLITYHRELIAMVQEQESSPQPAPAPR